jgi:hypothetical protein
MKVCVNVLPPTLGRGMHRTARALQEWAPAEVEIVSDVDAADVQVLHVIGVGSLEHLHLDDYVLLQYCYLTTERPDASFWIPLFRNARLVVSYYDLPALTGRDDFAFVHAPLGVDGEVFHDRGIERDAVVLTTGYVLEGEAIAECHDAAFRVLRGRRGGMIHIGPAFWTHRGLEVVEAISDEQLARRYSRSRYVSGLRRHEGFELPVLEGLACGARPICFDTPCYRQWFEGHAVFVPELPADELVPLLADVFREEPAPVTAEEREAVLAVFDWRRIVRSFWDRVLERG